MATFVVGVSRFEPLQNDTGMEKCCQLLLIGPKKNLIFFLEGSYKGK